MDLPNSISVAPQSYKSVPFKVESDWSAASYWYQIATLSPEAEIELVGLFHNSYQGRQPGSRGFLTLGNNNGVYPARRKTKKDR